MIRTSITYLAGSGGDVIKGVTPHVDKAFAGVGTKAAILLGLVWALMLMVAFGTMLVGMGTQRTGIGMMNAAQAEKGKNLMYGGLVGIFLLAGAGAIFGLVVAFAL